MTESQKPLLHRVVDLLIQLRFVLLSAAALALVAAWPIAQRLEFDQTIESLFAENDQHLVDYRESKSLFGGDEFVIVAYRDPKLFDSETRLLSQPAEKRLRGLAKRLNEIRGVNVVSTQELATLTRRTERAVDSTAAELGGIKGLLLRGFKRRAVKKAYQEAKGILLGEDSTTAVALRLRPMDDSPISRRETIREIRDAAKLWGEKESERAEGGRRFEVFVVGEPVQVDDMFRYVEDDGQRLFYWSLAALGIVILCLFRSLRWTLLPVLVVWTTINWTNALLVLVGARLSMVSSMMNSLVTIIGVATVMHITVHFRRERQTSGREEAARRTLAALLPAIFWTCATTATGFAALMSSDITPVRSFGLMLALATFVVLLAVVMVLPGAILLGRFDEVPRSAPGEDWLSGFLTATASIVQRRPIVVSAVMASIFVFSAFGLLRLRVETDFSKNFRESSDIVRSLDFVETKLGGAGTWDVSFPAPEELDDEYLAKVRRLAAKLRQEFVADQAGPQEAEHTSGKNLPQPPLKGEITKVIALTDAVDMIPSFIVEALARRLELVKQIQPEFTDSLYNPQARRMRIVIRSREREQSTRKLELIAAVEKVTNEWAKTELGKTAAEADVKLETNATGLYVLLAFLIDNLLKDQLVSFALAAAGIAVLMSLALFLNDLMHALPRDPAVGIADLTRFAFRSVVIGLASLIPNTFPIVLAIGGIGWLGIPVNIGTAMIASVSMGLTVDSSIHYIFGYRRARRRGLSVNDALQETQRDVGRALVFANLALIVGFTVLTLSHFIPLVYFGILVSVAMLGGLIGNLVLLPLLLQWVEGHGTRITPTLGRVFPPITGSLILRQKKPQMPPFDPTGHSPWALRKPMMRSLLW
jgi:hypothetical protein